MKCHFVSAAALLLGCATFLYADAVPVLPDPDIQIDVGFDSSGIGPFTAINGGGIFDFFNNTSQSILNLELTAQVNPGTFKCSVLVFFKMCSTNQDAAGNVTILFFGVNPEEVPPDPEDPEEPYEREGILPGKHFTINLNNGFAHPETPAGGWLLDGQNATLDMRANVPEPGSLFLLGGAGLLLAWRWKRRACPKG